MQKIVLNNKKSFDVISVVENYDKSILITFENSVRYEDVAEVYDPQYDVDKYSQDVLRKFEIYTNDELQGSHFGYTITKNISCLMGGVSVTLEKENELKTEIEVIKGELPNIAEEINAVGEQADFISEDSMFLAEAVFQMDERLMLTEEQVSIISELQERLISLEEQLNALNIQPLPIGGK